MRSDTPPVTLPPVGARYAGGVERGTERIEVERDAAQRHVKLPSITRDDSVLGPGGVANRRRGHDGVLHEADGTGVEHKRVPVAAPHLLVCRAADVDVRWYLAKHLVQRGIWRLSCNALVI